MAVGRASESIDNIQRAHELDPFSIIINSDVGKLLFLARLYDQAEAQLKEALRMDPDFFQTHFWLGAVYLMKHRFDEAIAEFKIGEVNGEEGMVAYAYGMAGKKTEAGKVLENQSEVTAYLLSEAKLAVVPFYAFGAGRGSAWYRLSVGTCKKEEIGEMIAKLREALLKLT